jgi:hypothetical protein
MLNYQMNSLSLEKLPNKIDRYSLHFLIEIAMLILSVVCYTCLEQIRGPEAAHPQEAALSWGCPHPSDEMEDVCPGRSTLEAK